MSDRASERVSESTRRRMEEAAVALPKGDGDSKAEAPELRIEVEGRTITLRDKSVVQIGRDVPDGIRVGGDSVSRVHAELRRTGPTWTLVDLDSLNGTFIDGKRIVEQTISAPVTVHLGLPESETKLVINPVSVPRVASNSPAAELNPAYAETMVATDLADVDVDSEPEGSGPNLVVQVGTARVAFPHSSTVSVGRMPDNDVVIADPACSRIHGYVEPTADGWTYRNVSSHGTFKAGEPVETLALDVPTVLKLGHPETGPRLELTHRGMVTDVIPRPSETRKVFNIGRHQIARRTVYGVLVVALYLAAAVVAVTYTTR